MSSQVEFVRPPEQEPPPVTRWYQFSLWSLLVAMTAFAILAWLGREVPRIRVLQAREARQRLDAEVLEAAGAEVSWNYEYLSWPTSWWYGYLGPKHIGFVRFDDFGRTPKVTDNPEVFEALARLETLHYIHFSFFKDYRKRRATLTDRDLGILAKSESIKGVSFYNADLSDEGVRALTRLTGLTKIRIWVSEPGWPPGSPSLYTRLTPAVGAAIALARDLEEVNLQMDLSEDTIGQLASLPHLKKLTLDGRQPHSLAPLAEIATLQELQINGGIMTEQTLDEIAQIPNLRRLYISKKRFSSDELRQLGRFDYLQHLMLDYGYSPDARAILEPLLGSKRLVLMNEPEPPRQ